jgi:hypothetical protein
MRNVYTINNTIRYSLKVAGETDNGHEKWVARAKLFSPTKPLGFVVETWAITEGMAHHNLDMLLSDLGQDGYMVRCEEV